MKMKRLQISWLIGLVIVVMVLAIGGCGSSSSSQNTSPSPSQNVTNLLTNGDFEADLTGTWNLFADSSTSGGTITRVSGITGFTGNCLELHAVTNGPAADTTNNWFLQAQYVVPLDLAPGNYRITLKASSDAAGSIQALVQTATYVYVGGVKASTTTSVQTFDSGSFTVSSPTTVNFMINWGGSGNNGITFHVDDVTLVKE